MTDELPRIDRGAVDFMAATLRSAGADEDGEMPEWFRPGYLREVAATIERMALRILELESAAGSLHCVEQAECSACHRTWTAVFPPEATKLECPSCGEMNPLHQRRAP